MSRVKGQAKIVEPQQSIPGMDGMQDDLSSLVVGLMDQNAELLNKLEQMESLVHKSREKAKVEAERINTKALERAERIVAKAKQRAEKQAQEVIRAAEEEASRIIVAAQGGTEVEALAVGQGVTESACEEAGSAPEPVEPEAIFGELTEWDLNAAQQKGVEKEESPATLHDSTGGFSIIFPRATEQLLKMPSRLKSLLKSRSGTRV